jgi:RNA polymerase sigma-70 factor (ECF subfamily)
VSTPPQGRGLVFPIVWGRDRAHSVSAPEAPVLQCLSDVEVMSRLQKHDSDALNCLFDRYSRLVLRIAFRILHDYGEAEEVVQEVFFQVFQKVSLFDSTKGTAKAWIVQIGFHRALDRKSYLDRRGFYFRTDIGGLNDSLPGETDPYRELETKLNRVQLEKAVEELPEMQRRTLELFYFEGFEVREIGDKLHESLGNVRHYLYRGLERLRQSAFVQKLGEK